MVACDKHVRTAGKGSEPWIIRVEENCIAFRLPCAQERNTKERRKKEKKSPPFLYICIYIICRGTVFTLQTSSERKAACARVCVEKSERVNVACLPIYPVCVRVCIRLDDRIFMHVRNNHRRRQRERDIALSAKIWPPSPFGKKKY